MDIVLVVIALLSATIAIITAISSCKSASASKCSADSAKKNIEIIEVTDIKYRLKPLCKDERIIEELKELRGKVDEGVLLKAMKLAVNEEIKGVEDAKRKIEKFKKIILYKENDF